MRHCYAGKKRIETLSIRRATEHRQHMCARGRGENWYGSRRKKWEEKDGKDPSKRLGDTTAMNKAADASYGSYMIGKKVGGVRRNWQSKGKARLPRTARGNKTL